MPLLQDVVHLVHCARKKTKEQKTGESRKVADEEEEEGEEQ